MVDVIQLRQQAEALRKAKNYEQAVPLYTELWQSEQATKWDGWGYGFCLRKCGRSADALVICREVYEMDATFVQNNSLYAWCIYDLHIKGHKKGVPVREPEFLKAATAIVNLCAQEQYSPFEMAVFRVVDYLTGKNIYPAQHILDWINRLDPALLSTDDNKFEDSEGKQREIASPREKYYMIRTKALFEVEDYVGCIECCQAALGENLHLHYNNDAWFYRRIALSKSKLGLQEEAIAELAVVLRRKKDWFIQRDLAELLVQVGRFDEAQKYALDAALNAGDTEYKVGLFALLADIFERKGESEFAHQHIALVLKIYEEQGWTAPRDLVEKAEQWQVATASGSSGELERALRREWEKFKPRIRGTIKKYIADKEFGFITGEDNQDYHFRLRAFRRRDDEPEIGMSVTFVPEKSWDAAKNRESLSATNIRAER